MLKYMALCVLNVFALVAGQTLFKIGVGDRAVDSLSAMMKLFFSPWILAGLTLYAFTTLLWLYILSKIPISRAYPIQALAYPLMLIVSGVVFKENISATRWLGVGVIFAGVALAAR